MSFTPAVPAIDNNLQSIIQKRVTDSIRGNFAELIPDEAFAQMVASATDEFLNGARHHRFTIREVYLNASDPRNTTGKAGYARVEEPKENSTYSAVADPSTLPGMIYLELVKLATAGIKEILEKDERFKIQYDPDTGTQYIEIVNKIVGDNAAAFMRALMSNIVQWNVMQSVNSMRQSNGMPNYIPSVPPGF